jgi:hypothetical protein
MLMAIYLSILNYWQTVYHLAGGVAGAGPGLGGVGGGGGGDPPPPDGMGGIGGIALPGNPKSGKALLELEPPCVSPGNRRALDLHLLLAQESHLHHPRIAKH